MSTRNRPRVKGCPPAPKAVSLATISEAIVYKIWEPRRLIILLSSVVCYKDSVIFFSRHLSAILSPQYRCSVLLLSNEYSPVTAHPIGAKFKYWLHMMSSNFSHFIIPHILTEMWRPYCSRSLGHGLYTRDMDLHLSRLSVWSSIRCSSSTGVTYHIGSSSAPKWMTLIPRRK
jgi:hypothetical protein